MRCLDICVFMGVIPFCLVVCKFCCSLSHSRKFGTKFRQIFKTTEFLIPLRQSASAFAQGSGGQDGAAGAKWSEDPCYEF